MIIDKKFILNHILLDVPKISQAKKINNSKERAKNYKAIDDFGNVYLVQNPYTFRVLRRDGYTFRERRKPKLVYTHEQALEEIKRLHPSVKQPCHKVT